MFIVRAADVLHSVRSAMLSISSLSQPRGLRRRVRCTCLLTECELSVGAAAIKIAPLRGVTVAQFSIASNWIVHSAVSSLLLRSGQLDVGKGGQQC